VTAANIPDLSSWIEHPLDNPDARDLADAPVRACGVAMYPPTATRQRLLLRGVIWISNTLHALHRSLTQTSLKHVSPTAAASTQARECSCPARLPPARGALDCLARNGRYIARAPSTRPLAAAGRVALYPGSGRFYAIRTRDGRTPRRREGVQNVRGNVVRMALPRAARASRQPGEAGSEDHAVGGRRSGTHRGERRPGVMAPGVDPD
jgi:hypothetical protein